jgi:hypothetical protein
MLSKNKRRKKLKHQRKKKNWCYVYAIHHGDENGPIIYVGQTRLIIEDRLSFHYKDIKKASHQNKKLSPFHKWLNKAINENYKVSISCLDENGIWDISEAVWIDRLIASGHPLLNVASVVGNHKEYAQDRLNQGLVIWNEDSIETYS